jgi:L-glutamine-phosphate cytidylyltransferase
VKLVILAAGRGERLMPLTRETPKSVLDLGDGSTLIGRQLRAAAECGADVVRVVTGYRAAEVQAALAGHDGPQIESVYNPFFHRTSTLASAWIGLRDVDPPVVLLNGDDIFQSVVLRRLLECSGEIAAVVAPKPAYDEEDMKVLLAPDGSIAHFGKDVPVDAADGEAIGMTLFRDDGLGRVQHALDSMMRDKSNFGQFYEAAYELMIADGARFDVCTCGPDEWAEIDFPRDLEAVRTSLLRRLPPAGA